MARSRTQKKAPSNKGKGKGKWALAAFALVIVLAAAGGGAGGSGGNAPGGSPSSSLPTADSAQSRQAEAPAATPPTDDEAAVDASGGNDGTSSTPSDASGNSTSDETSDGSGANAADSTASATSPAPSATDADAASTPTSGPDGGGPNAGPSSSTDSPANQPATAPAAASNTQLPVEALTAVEDAPDYAGFPSIEINGGEPWLSLQDVPDAGTEIYSPLDDLGRCGTAFALIGPETMPTGSRGQIGNVRPSGWQIARYDWVDGAYLFNRCHLIGWQLSGENDNARNLITGTRSMNTAGMEPFEGQVAAYVLATGNHVLYRATPVFAGRELVARGVLMEALSVEDDGAGVRFCAWCYNVEPGVRIDYATGENEPDGTRREGEGLDAETYDYILNVSSNKFHRPDCPSVEAMSEKNKRGFNGTREEAIAQGYEPCGVCQP